jgi:DNA-binding NtrC family response regulator
MPFRPCAITTGRGNVRELMNVIERVILLCKTDKISMVELPHVFREDQFGAYGCK